MQVKQGDRGQLVRLVQASIGVGVDGAFGPATAAAVAAARAAHGLPPGEVADEALFAALGVGLVRGIDVSHHNGVIDWQAVAASGVKFAWVKCTQNDGYADPMFGANVAAARKVGILCGAYHFAVAERNDAPQEVAWFLRCCGSLQLDLPPVLDLESNPGDLTAAQLCAWADEWRRLVHEATGGDPLLYTGLSFLIDRMGGGRALAPGWRLWVARYNGAADPCTAPYPNLGAFDRYTVWQYTQNGRVPGIGGDVDLDVLPGGVDAIAALCLRADVQGPGN